MKLQTFGGLNSNYSKSLNKENSLGYGGGDIKQILNHQYEKDYILKA